MTSPPIPEDWSHLRNGPAVLDAPAAPASEPVPEDFSGSSFTCPPPEAPATIGDEKPNAQDDSPDRLPGAPLAWTAAAGLAALALVFALVEAVRFVTRAADLTPALGWVSAAAGLLLALSLSALVAREWRAWGRLASRRRLRAASSALAQNPFNSQAASAYQTEALKLAGALAASDTPAANLATALERLDRDGAAHAEWAAAIDQALDPLDQQAARRIQKEAVNTGLAAAFSPYGFLDAAIVLWRNAVLVRSIARVYQSRAGLAGSLSIARHVIVAIALADLTQEASTALFGGFRGLASLISPAGQGLASAALTVRVGLVAQRHCRPIPMPKEKEQGLIALLSQSAVEAVRGQIRARRKPTSDRPV